MRRKCRLHVSIVARRTGRWLYGYQLAVRRTKSYGSNSNESPYAVCPWHFWAFRLDNGQLRDSPGVAITTYKTRIHELSDGRPALIQAELPIY